MSPCSKLRFWNHLKGAESRARQCMLVVAVAMKFQNISSRSIWVSYINWIQISRMDKWCREHFETKIHMKIVHRSRQGPDNRFHFFVFTIWRWSSVRRTQDSSLAWRVAMQDALVVSSSFRYDSTLNAFVNAEGTQLTSISADGFSHLMAGVRGNVAFYTCSVELWRIQYDPVTTTNHR